MTDERLEQVLREALVPEISDSDIQLKEIRKTGSGTGKRNWIKPVLAACMTFILLGTGGILFYQVKGNVDDDVTKVKEKVENAFSMKVQAKAQEEITLEAGKEVPMIFPENDMDMPDLGEWSGNQEESQVSYAIRFPLVCQGKNIKTVTYQINKGAFMIVTPEGADIIQSGEKYQGTFKDFENSSGDMMLQEGEEYEKDFYTSYTVYVDDQPNEYRSAEYDVSFCNEVTVPKSDFKKLWGHFQKEKMQDELEAKNKLFKDLMITCTVTYKDGSTDKAEISVKNRIMKPENAGGEAGDPGNPDDEEGKEQESSDFYGVVPTFTMQ